MAEKAILHQVRLRADHVRTGGTRHFRGPKLLPPPASLEIAKYSDDEGYYLFHCDEAGIEFTDTYHESIECALAQAEFEFGVKPTEWTAIAVGTEQQGRRRG